ncbi:uncharacterized protein LOC129778089 [Toxorhynchites rutilus septentrionalis]|uniref:uncharacterized protein LOC129778089 n=1 Tax=Toxorhynchites rutilus septentrionalis TaxID=329112 RepID=UPI00247B2280|nr:uncharacterized protein LOC129778089 [Toxorhynchites rutilus septentrionalis]
MEIWNKLDLVPPVLFTHKCKTKNRKDDIRSFCSTIATAHQYFESLHAFEKAAAYLSRFAIRFNDRFYNMHGFRQLKKLKQALLRFRVVDVSHVLSNMSSMLPYTGYLEKSVELPTRSNLDYLLVRLQGLGKLFCRIVVLAKDAAKYYVRFITTSYFFNLTSIFLCLLAEIWCMSKVMCARIVDFYNRLVPFRMLLEDAGKQWPTEGECVFPDDLATWLGSEWIEEVAARDDSTKSLNLRTDTNLFQLLTEEQEDFSSSKEVDRRIENKLSSELDTELLQASIPSKLLMQRIRTDDGETIVRESTKSAKSELDLSAIDSIRSKYDVKKFLEDEKQRRKQNLTLALTRTVNESTFSVFSTSMMRDLHKLSTKDYVTLFKDEFGSLVVGKMKKNRKYKSTK